MHTECDEPRWDVPDNGHSNRQPNQWRDSHSARRAKHIRDGALLNGRLHRLDDPCGEFSLGLYFRKAAYFNAPRLQWRRQQVRSDSRVLNRIVNPDIADRRHDVCCNRQSAADPVYTSADSARIPRIEAKADASPSEQQRASQNLAPWQGWSRAGMADPLHAPVGKCPFGKTSRRAPLRAKD